MLQKRSRWTINTAAPPRWLDSFEKKKCCFDRSVTFPNLPVFVTRMSDVLLLVNVSKQEEFWQFLIDMERNFAFIDFLIYFKLNWFLPYPSLLFTDDDLPVASGNNTLSLGFLLSLYSIWYGLWWCRELCLHLDGHWGKVQLPIWLDNHQAKFPESIA